MATVTHEVRRIIAVDFDDCLCQSHWPECGPPIWSTINAVKAEQAKGSAIILWTARCDKPLQDAVEWCRKYGIEFDAVNEQIPEQLALYASVPGVTNPDPRKIHASEYWDDRAVRMPNPQMTASNHTERNQSRRKRRSRKWYVRLWRTITHQSR